MRTLLLRSSALGAAACLLAGLTGMAHGSEDKTADPAVLEKLTTKLAAETQDIAWANAVEIDVQEAFRIKKPEGASLAGITCGASVCRIEVKYAADAELKLARSMATSAVALSTDCEVAPSDMASGEDGARTQTLYLNCER